MTNKIYNFDELNNISENLYNLMSYLYDRWYDEREYEDIKTYAQPIQKAIEMPVTMTKRPFGFKTTLQYQYRNGVVLTSEFKVFFKNDRYQWSVGPKN